MIKFLIKYSATILLLANITIRLLFVLFPFWGLEYEDSFIFNDTARYLNNNYYFKSDFLTQSCIDGSFNNCNSYASFGGHFLTFPFILSIFNYLFGYNVYNIFLLNFIFSILILLTVFFWHKKVRNKNEFSLDLFLILMLITPFITVFHTSGLSETLSSLMIILSIIFIQKANEIDFNIFHYSFWLTFIFIIGAVITKRENLLLISLLILIPYFRKIQKKKIIPSGYILLSFIVLISIFLFSYLINIPSIEFNEGIAIGRQTFSFTFLIKNLIQLFFALLNFKYWGLTGILFIASIILYVLRKSHSSVGVLFFFISLFYMILYSSHYRSFYQVHYDINHPFETLRYSVNYFPLICIFISSIDLRKLFILKQSYIKPIFISSVFLIIILIFNAIQTRIGFSRDEYYSRIEQVEKTLEIAKENDIIISDLPIVFHCFVSNKQRIIDYYSLSEEALKILITQNRDYDIYLIKAKLNSIDSIRYKMNIHLNQFCYFKTNIEIEHSELIKFCNNAPKN